MTPKYIMEQGICNVVCAKTNWNCVGNETRLAILGPSVPLHRVLRVVYVGLCIVG